MDGVTVINDCYNANPASLRTALDLLRDVSGNRRMVVVVGTMRELGAESEALHLEAARLVLDRAPAVVAAVGDFGKAFEALGDRSGATRLIVGATPEDVGAGIKAELKAGDVLVIPAGTGHQFTKIDDHITYLMIRVDPDKVVPLMDEAASQAYRAAHRQR